MAISKKPESLQKIDELECDDVPLTEEELEQLESRDGYISGKDAKREFRIQVDLP
jgi:hypothetical protein